MMLICEVCGKEFNSYGRTDRRACSKQCGNIRIPKKPQVEVTCGVCGKIFKTTKTYRKTCSLQCGLIWRKNKVKPIVDGMKQCVNCLQSKPIEEFYACKGKIRSYCKSCDNRLIIKYQTNNKRKYVELKGGKCQKCGYNKCIGALEFHHLDKDGKLFEISELLGS